ncbi:HAD family hydrolase [Winogradskyella aurantiaca]|uniref:HAD family hydrolase n=1 Tax=Winogradskyella aurantiaca TaxID=2219558 RepID=UPI000E1DC021|nr:HAD family phosphatase [Winogradskyella aurantiaca]
MIKAIIFDFGDVFINLDKSGALENALDLFEINEFSEDLIQTNMLYEMGQMDSATFIEFYLNRFPKCSRQDIIEAWNFILRDFPIYRLNFLKQLQRKKKFELILLSNTNEMHIDFIKNHVPFYEEFKSCFQKFYLSHEIKMRKPDAITFEYVLNDIGLRAKECLFIDDTKENTDAAEQIGIHTWNINENSEDVIDLFSIKATLF